MKSKAILRKFWASPLSLLIPALVIPLFIKNMYTLHVLIISIVAAISALGLRLILSTGHLSLGQAVFLAAGAYTSISLVGRLGFSFWLALPLSGIVAAVLAVLIGWPALRLKGTYFAVLTFGLGEAVRLILLNFWKLTGGASGIPGGETSIKVIPPPETIALMGLPKVVFDSKVPYYYLALLLLMITAVVMHRIHSSRTGTILRAIEQSDSLAKSVGINITSYNLWAFTTACFFTGLAGAFLAHYLRSVTPKDFTFLESIDIVIYTIIGGKGSIFGPIIGAVGMKIMGSYIGFLKQYQSVVYGVFAILVLMVLPNGLVSLPRLLLHRFLNSKAWFKRIKK